MSTETNHVTRHVPAKTYLGVFALLFVVTAIEVGISQLISDKTLVVILLLSLAVVKAALVMMFFMHLKYDAKPYSLLLIFPLFMAILLAAVVLVAAANA
ncbi:MAG TPA: cytochrome C oxidase subunit IV family protein [Anaerolineae bacterium]|nr:cytochrome C oxidase subunit IV family protein [Anaerolineae bacterium]